MIRSLGFAALGLLLVALGFVASPWPWAAPVVPGLFLAVLGVVGLFRTEVAE